MNSIFISICIRFIWLHTGDGQHLGKSINWYWFSYCGVLIWEKMHYRCLRQIKVLIWWCKFSSGNAYWFPSQRNSPLRINKQRCKLLKYVWKYKKHQIILFIFSKKGPFYPPFMQFWFYFEDLTLLCCNECFF